MSFIGFNETVLISQPALLRALRTAVLQGKGSDVSQILQSPLNFLDQSLLKGSKPYLTGVQCHYFLLRSCSWLKLI